MNAPVIVSFATSETPLWKIPFPAITVCPLTRTEKSKFDFEYFLSLRENHTEFEEEKATKFDYMSLVCSRTLDSILNENSSKTVSDSVNTFLIEVCDSFKVTLRHCFKVSPNFQDIVHTCKWVGQNCSNLVFEYFTPILTSFGVCYTFNMLDRDEIFTEEAALDYYESLSIIHQPKAQWSLEKGYFDKSPLHTFPRRTILTGTTGGLELIFKTSEQDMDYHCEESLRGYKIILHHPAEIPRSHQNYFWVPLNQLVSVSVKPNMMTTAEELQRYDPEARKCCFYGERRLRFFHAYNQQNCLLECLANYTRRICDCVAFYMPRK
ncbi:hypothetical protein ILUMI_18549 [Ignelater luminosus]|uniref:Uncharacterized protein n=1 Tax=Ignelater luminosus TaxID=2038154 RepID=A0A8K0G6A6_IGNLU|nr:hypothetical protein ILUMI_18549 [Ignelater luminosus]